MDDLISRAATIDAVENLVASMSVCINVDEYNGMRDMKYRALKAINKLPSAQEDADSAYTEGYTAAESKYRKMWDEMPTIKPERKRMSNKEWVDFLSEQFTVSRTSAREMLHGLMKWKAEDNFKKQFSGRKA